MAKCQGLIFREGRRPHLTCLLMLTFLTCSRMTHWITYLNQMDKVCTEYLPSEWTNSERHGFQIFLPFCFDVSIKRHFLEWMQVKVTGSLYSVL